MRAPNLKVLCCGGRNYFNQLYVNQTLDAFRAAHGDFAVIHGGARGADGCCGIWGKSKGLPVIEMNANWNFYDKAAGPIRNGWMIDLLKPNYGIAFPGGNGTQDMIKQMNAAGIPVWVVARG